MKYNYYDSSVFKEIMGHILRNQVLSVELNDSEFEECRLEYYSRNPNSPVVTDEFQHTGVTFRREKRTLECSKEKLWSDGKCHASMVIDSPTGCQDIVFNLLQDITCLQEDIQELKNASK